MTVQIYKQVHIARTFYRVKWRRWNSSLQINPSVFQLTIQWFLYYCTEFYIILSVSHCCLVGNRIEKNPIRF